MSLSDKIYIPTYSSEEDFELNGLIPVLAIKEAVKELKSKLGRGLNHYKEHHTLSKYLREDMFDYLFYSIFGDKLTK